MRTTSIPAGRSSRPNAPAPEQRARKFLIFRCASQEFALPVSVVREIIGWQPITPVPQTNDSVLGVINLRGRVIPVIDLERKLALSPAAAARREYGTRTCIIVLQPESGPGADAAPSDPAVRGPVGVAVDAVCDVVAVAASDIEDASNFGRELLRAHYVEAVAKVRGTIKMLLNLDKALAGPELSLNDAGPISSGPRAAEPVADVA